MQQAAQGLNLALLDSYGKSQWFPISGFSYSKPRPKREGESLRGGKVVTDALHSIYRHIVQMLKSPFRGHIHRRPRGAADKEDQATRSFLLIIFSAKGRRWYSVFRPFFTVRKYPRSIAFFAYFAACRSSMLKTDFNPSPPLSPIVCMLSDHWLVAAEATACFQTGQARHARLVLLRGGLSR